MKNNANGRKYIKDIVCRCRIIKDSSNLHFLCLNTSLIEDTKTFRNVKQKEFWRRRNCFFVLVRNFLDCYPIELSYI